MEHTHTQKVSHLFPHHIQHQINIFITKHGYRTLMNVVINNLNFSNMVQHASSTRTHAATTHATIVAQEKTQSYTKRALGDNFIPLVIKTYGCFHSCFNSFFTTCVQTTITFHQKNSLVPTVLFIIIGNMCP